MQISAQNIEVLISSDIDACEKLLMCLEKEREALKARDADALGEIIEQKVGYLSHLEESAKTRTAWAQANNATSTDDSWKAILNGLNNNKVKQDWAKLKTLLEDCRTQNEVNGKLLSRNQQVYSRLLDVMRGQTNSPSLYNAVGEKSSGGSSQIVGEA